MQFLPLLLLLGLAPVLGSKCPHDATTTTFPDTTDDLPFTTPNPRGPQSWPTGRFSLLMAGASCPDYYPFAIGTFYQDTEDFDNKNEWPRESDGLLGPMTFGGFQWHFCSKITWDCKATDAYHWPEGNYCIHKKGSLCPDRNFKEGWVFWDDEDDMNANYRSGSLPKGTFGRDTNMTYCCRNDGDTDIPISLPASQPFYLYPYTGGCQKVEHMWVTEEEVITDTENDGRDSKGGHTPKIMICPQTKTTKTYLCLYKPEP